MTKKQKLELTWIGKENRPKLEPRILLEDPEKSYHASHKVTDGDLFDNRLIFGDNLLALKALEQDFTGKIKCIYIDPPFNTQQAFEHYDDGIEHSLWLSLMRDRLELLRNLLSSDGTLFVHIDDNELGYLKDEEEVLNVLQSRRKELADAIHAQMQAHHWEKSAGYDVVVTKGFTTLKHPAATAADAAVHNFRHPVADKSKIAQLAFGGFSRCLFPIQKFQSDTERVLAVILDRDALKWFRPSRGQFQIHYKWGNDSPEYQPDFVAEAEDTIFMLEPKARNDLTDGEVQAKKDAAVQWCQRASEHNAKHGGKPWKYLLIAHDFVAENMNLKGLAAQFAQ